MTKLIRFTLTSVVIILLAMSVNSSVSAHGSGRSPHDNQRDHTMMNGNSLRHTSDHMSIEGTISVDKAILLNLKVSPNDEMEGMMNDHMGSDAHMGDQSRMQDYINEITVEFYALVEFEDNTSNAFSADDSQISNFTLSNITLQQPMVEDGKYTIVSFDNSTFIMEIDLKFEDDLFHGLKWSVEMNYPFLSNSSSLALLHRISTTGGSMMDQHQMQHGNMHQTNHMQYQENHMNDNHEYLPMAFEWATTAFVDGVEKSISATGEDDIFALSIPQGQTIFYDPEISARVEDIRSLDQQLSDLFGSIQNFVDTVNSPTLLGIVLGFSSISLLVFIAVYTRKN